VLARQNADAATLYWDGTGTSWSSVGSWSTVDSADTPDPAAVPGAADIATFVVPTAVTAQTVNLDGTQSALGLATNVSNTFLTTIRAGGTNTALNLGTSGINHIGGVGGGLAIGSTTLGQQVSIRLQGAQTWTSSTAGTGAGGIQVLNDVSIGAGGDQTLTLAGINNSQRISGAVSDGSGVLSIAKTGTGVWFLSGANTYTGATTITDGVLRVENNQALGSTSAGTVVGNNTALQLANNITVTGEALTLVGNGSGGNTGALRNISGNNTWTGSIAVSPAATTRVVSDAGFLLISGGVSLSSTATDQFVLQGFGNGEVSGVISGVSRVTKSATGGGTWTLSGANTYTGKTTITNGTLVASSLNSVVGGTASSSLGAPTTAANGTLDLGGGTTVGVLRYTGSGETTDRVINLPGGAGSGGVIDQSGTGLLKFTSNSTAAAGAKTLTLQGSTAGIGEFAGVIGGASLSVTKAGTGTWRLTRANTYTGGTNINGGTLTVDLALNPTGVLPSASVVTTGGGTLNIVGASSGVSSQTVGSLALANGQSRVVINPNGGSGTTLTVTSATVTTVPNSRITFDYTQGTTNGSTIGNNVIAWNPTLTNGMIGTNFMVSDTGGLGFATVSSGNVVRLIPLGLPQSGAAANENYILSTNTSSSTPGSLNLTQTAGQTINTLTVDTAATSGTLSVGSTVLSSKVILVSGLTTNTFSIAGSSPGGIRAAVADTNLILENHSAGTFTISAPLVENGLGGVANNGTGTTVLSGVNTYTAPTILNDGIMRFSGTMGATAVTINGNAIGQMGSATGLSSINSIIFGPSSAGKFQANGLAATVGSIATDAVAGTPVVENASATPGSLTIAPLVNSTYAGVFRDGAGGGSLGLTLTVSDVNSTLILSGSEGSTQSGLTTINGSGIVEFGKTGGNAVGGNLLISNGGRLRFTQSNQIADTASVTLSDAGSIFNGTAFNTGVLPINETFANLTITGGSMATGVGTTGFNITGATSVTGGNGNSIFLCNSGGQFATSSLSLTDMTGTAGGTVETINTFSIFGNSPTARSKLTVGAGGLLLNGSVLNVRRGGAGAMGSRLVLDGDVSTAGSLPSSINLDTMSGTNGVVSVDLSSTAGSVERNFNVAGGGADLSVSVPLVNGAATTASITKLGPGTLTLAATNTYNGATNVKSGTVIVSGTASGSAAFVGNSTSPAAVAILMGGNGAVSTTPTVSDISAITSGASVDPGIGQFSAGVLNTNTFSLTNSARLTIQVGGVFAGGNGIDGYDRINVLSPAVSASVSGGFLDLADMSIGALPTDALLFILVNNGTGTPSSPFSGVTLGGSPVANLNNIVIGGQQFSLVYSANFDGFSGPYGGSASGGNDIALVAIPEPASVAALLCGSSLLTLRWRRTRARIKP
jgi:autotransporter-associated beta strand protein